ncbi:MAG: PP2C family protein-serine/threonine phosphatase [Microbacterium sp.]|uniref:PP2C family protein-serine/threonine phosphatase n=1 Tax=Microbacterium sp. TaxID=51671 RepID=UPI003F952C6F
MSVDSVRLSVASVSDRGLVRTANEDSVLDGSPVFLVADGMGGHDAGDLASAAVVDAFRPLVGGTASVDAVREALQMASESVERISAGTRRGAGSTVAGVALIDHDGLPHWLVFNVGDSRVYRFHGTDLEQMTVDHSLGQEMVDAGQLRREDLSTFAQRNVITRAVGTPGSAADSWLVPVTDGERLLICSDGLTGEVNDESIRATLTMSGRPEPAVTALLHRAKRGGGRDNISVVVVDVISGGVRARAVDATGGRLASSTLGGSTIDATTMPVRSRGARV